MHGERKSVSRSKTETLTPPRNRAYLLGSVPDLLGGGLELLANVIGHVLDVLHAVGGLAGHDMGGVAALDVGHGVGRLALDDVRHLADLFCFL